MKITEKLNKYKIAKNTSAMALAQVASRIAMILYLAALSRHVGTEGIGQISTGTAINAIFLLVVGPGLTTLLIREVAGDHKLTNRYLSNAIFLRLLLIVPFIALTTVVAHLSGYPQETMTIIHLYTLVFILDTLGEVMIGAFRAYERMELEAGLQLLRDFSNIGLSLVAIALGWPLLAIVFVSVVAQLLKFAATVFLLFKHITRLHFRVELPFSRHLLFASLPFGLLLVIQTLQSEFGTYILSLHYAAEVVGIYAAANTVILMILFLPNSFAAAIYPTFSRLHKQSDRQLRDFYRVCYKYLLVLGFPLAVGTLLVGERAIMLVYGEEFAAAAPVMQVMSVFLFTIVGYANGSLLYAIDQQRFYAWTQAAAALINGVLCLILIPRFGPLGAAVAFTASGLLTFFVHSRACHRLLQLSLPLGLMGRVFAAAVVMGLAVVGSIRVGVPWLLAALVLAPPIYLGLLFLLNVIRRDELRILGGGSSEAEPHPAIIAEATPNV